MNPEPVTGFTIRVYGVLIDPVKGILLSDEFEYGRHFTKFPGGGLEPGEGTRECLVREWKEETGQPVSTGEHIYTTDHFQRSAFHSEKQVISIYYYVHTLGAFHPVVSEKAFDFEVIEGRGQSLRWVKMNVFSEEHLTFPLDKLVAQKVLGK